ncbi:hypothetical protein PNEG_04279 [Pneumocystis murina B123]|uniref:Uncharacterized protein n=1 Tax=Pneumocystis murina (strain B123) TaxID=1069680 RepID=A0A0W4ZX25_PNEMU|nr:hypothetical protein PNEG_04279 [Pneumocystis murina B123]KTW32910.1 hypothetical protein PNEG_04279 [Pneumocystis murina B123]
MFYSVLLQNIYFLCVFFDEVFKALSKRNHNRRLLHTLTNTCAREKRRRKKVESGQGKKVKVRDDILNSDEK